MASSDTTPSPNTTRVGWYTEKLRSAPYVMLFLVEELRRHARGALDQLLRGVHVLDDGRHLPLELELLLHHRLDGIELLPDHRLPARVLAGDAEGRLLAFGAAD